MCIEPDALDALVRLSPDDAENRWYALYALVNEVADVRMRPPMYRSGR